jgi:hypothetical protein
VLDPDTFLTTLYVMVDDFCQSHLPPTPRPGPAPSLSCSEVVTLALFGQWGWFPSERAFYRWATRHLRRAFPRLPDRSQFNRLLRSHWRAIVAFFHFLVTRLGARLTLYEALDATAIPVRNCKRRGRGWFAGQANIGFSNRVGWYFGFHLLISVHPQGAITGFAFGAASTKDQPLAESFFALRHQPDPRLPTVGQSAVGYYLADKGFAGELHHQRWRHAYEAVVVCGRQRPTRAVPHSLPRAWRRWLASLRQIVETVNEKLLYAFRLGEERPHDLSGLHARLAAKMALHNFCIWLNQQLGRPNLAFADLVAW